MHSTIIENLTNLSLGHPVAQLSLTLEGRVLVAIGLPGRYDGHTKQPAEQAGSRYCR